MTGKFRVPIVSSGFWLAAGTVVLAMATVVIAVVAVAQWVDNDSALPQQVPLPTPQVSPLGDTGSDASGPILYVRYLVSKVNADDSVWTDSIEAKPGDTLKFYVEIHNTQVGTTATSATVRTILSPSELSSGTSTVTFWAANALEVQDYVSLRIDPEAHLEFVPGSTRLSWDRDGDGSKDYHDTPLPDGIAQGGIPIGDINGCNEYIAQIAFLADVKE